MAEMSLLRRRMIEDMTVRNLSPATQRSYVSLRRGPPFVDREDERRFGFRLRRGGGRCPQVRLWAQVCRSGCTGLGLRR
jgi:hypothetical protein